jgi:hypothetical protein
MLKRLMLLLLPALFLITTNAEAGDKGYGFLTAAKTNDADLVFFVHYRTSGDAVVRYSGKRRKGTSWVPVKGQFSGKLGAKNRKLSGPTGSVALPTSAPKEYDEAGPGIVHAPRVWGTAKDGFDFSISSKGFDNPLVGFDNPLVGFDNPLVGFGKASSMKGVAVDALGGSLKGVAVAKTVGGKTTIAYAVKRGGKLVTGVVGGAATKSAKLSSARTQFNGSVAKAAGASGQLKIKIGSKWQTANVKFDAVR